MRFIRSSKGSVLLEAVVALGVIVVVMTAMAVIITSALANATFIKNQNRANKYAQEGIDIVRMVRDSDYRYFDDHYVTILQPDTTGGPTVNQLCIDQQYDLTSCPSDDPVLNQGFHRSIYIQRQCGVGTSTDSNTFQVKVDVSWFGGSCGSADRFCHKAEVVTCLSTNPNTANL